MVIVRVIPSICLLYFESFMFDFVNVSESHFSVYNKFEQHGLVTLGVL